MSASSDRAEPERSSAGAAAEPGLTARAALGRRRWLPDWVIAVCIGAIASVLAWFRQPTAARDTIWAEDGPIFLFPWGSGHGWASVFAPYDGYLHVVPRLLGGLVFAVSSVANLADTLIVVCCVCYGVVAGLVFYFSRDVVDLIEARLTLALITVLAPVAGWESMHNFANLHWFLLWLAPWVLLARPRTTAGTVLMALLALAIALTEVQAVILAPLVLWLWKRRASWPIFLAFGAGCIAQVICALSNPRVRVPTASPPWTSTVAGYLLNNGISFWDSNRSEMAFVVQKLGWIVGFLAIAPFLVAFVVAFRNGTSQVRVATVTLLVGSVVGWTVAFVVNRDPDYYYTRLPIDPAHGLTLVRWATATSMFVIAALPLMVAVLARDSRQWRIIGGTALAAAVVIMSTSLVQTGHSRGGPGWHESVSEAEASCEADPEPTIDVPIQPVNWFLVLQCSVITQD